MGVWSSSRKFFLMILMIYLSCLFDTSCYVDAAGRAKGPLYTPKGKFMQVIMISTQYLCINSHCSAMYLYYCICM